MQDTDTPLDLAAFIRREGDELVTDSRAVAIAFGKRHKDVLRAIDAMALSAEPIIRRHHQRNFAPVCFQVPGHQGAVRDFRAYSMTQRGLSELAMSFTGTRARLVRLHFLDAFDRVMHQLQSVQAQYHALERDAALSKAKGSFGSRLMNERKVEAQDFRTRFARLDEVLAPGLPFDGPADLPAPPAVDGADSDTKH